MYAQANGLNLDEILNISIPTFKPVFVPESRFQHFMRTIGITLISGALSFGIAFVGTSVLMTYIGWLAAAIISAFSAIVIATLVSNALWNIFG